jgi:hypothetical protein
MSNGAPTAHLRLADIGSGAGQTMSHGATGSPFTKNNRRRAITGPPSATPRRSATLTGAARAISNTAAQASKGTAMTAKSLGADRRVRRFVMASYRLITGI